MRSNFQIYLAQNQSNKQFTSVQALSPLEIHMRNSQPPQQQPPHPPLTNYV